MRLQLQQHRFWPRPVASEQVGSPSVVLGPVASSPSSSRVEVEEERRRDGFKIGKHRGVDSAQKMGFYTPP